jgi:hypothetical protein
MLIKFHGPGDLNLDIKIAFHVLLPFSGEIFPQGAVLNQVFDRIRQAFHVAGPGQDSRFPVQENLGNPPGSAPDDGNPAGQGLGDNKPEGFFPQGWNDDDIGAPQDEFHVVAQPQESDPITLQAIHA